MSKTESDYNLQFDFVDDYELRKRNLQNFPSAHDLPSKNKNNINLGLHSDLETSPIMSNLKLSEDGNDSYLDIDGGCHGKLIYQDSALRSSLMSGTSTSSTTTTSTTSTSTTTSTSSTTTTTSTPSTIVVNTCGNNNIVQVFSQPQQMPIIPNHSKFSTNDTYVNGANIPSGLPPKQFHSTFKNEKDFQTANTTQKVKKIINVPTGTVTEWVCHKVSQNVSPQKWKTLARELKLKQNKIDEIEMDNMEQSVEAFYQMLLAWRESRGSGATFEALGRALLKCNEAPVVKKLAEFKSFE
ncbi:hypothetical protein HELRODRAFT_193092 [Helobdella robusta]|uniref:Death domain-containing protein n=1 Tax=Helobdella robusta TaxID=6412 RepID=T1FUM3_HELRO|nr:hypothetical protein HELRODRAFT_193092 [Helobdella robusta]ESN98107.1 hypothetical protein HELRODRAFT_193092 [Helobdella robusta]